MDEVPVTVTCRVLKLARQPYHRRLDRPVADAVLEEACRANALFDAHRDAPGCATASWPMKRVVPGLA